MDLFDAFALSDENLVFFATGLGVGAMLWAAAQSSLHRRQNSGALAVRVARLEMRLASDKNFTALARAMQALEQKMPALGSTNVVTLFAAAQLPQLRSSTRSDPEDIAKQFGDSMRDNTIAAVEIAKSIIDQGVNLNDAKDRREVAARIKKFGQGLSTAFWDKHGELMLASSLPANLKNLLRVFFAQVKRLKSATAELAKEPSFADLDALLDRAIDLLDTAKAIIDELERLSQQ
ncbi:MAG: hypothetical protein ABL973_14830 [Micropepsaceae bacterium]